MGAVPGTVKGDKNANTFTTDVGGGITAYCSLNKETDSSGKSTLMLTISKFTKPGQLGPCNPPLKIPVDTIDPKAPHKSRPKMGKDLSGHEDFYKRLCDVYDKLPESVKKWLDDHNYTIMADWHIPDGYARSWGGHVCYDDNGVKSGEIHIAFEYNQNGAHITSEDKIDLYSGLAHEIGHAIDNEYNLSSKPEFKTAYDRDIALKYNGVDLSMYSSGQGNGKDNYSDDSPGTDGKNTTRGKQEVAADLISYELGANGRRANKVDMAFENVMTLIDHESNMTPLKGQLQQAVPNRD
jgi:hypothetical protein